MGAAVLALFAIIWRTFKKFDDSGELSPASVIKTALSMYCLNFIRWIYRCGRITKNILIKLN